jgi:hypothetical protein
LSAQHCAVTKLLLLALAVIAIANWFAGDRSEPPLLIDNAQATAPLDAHN